MNSEEYSEARALHDGLIQRLMDNPPENEDYEDRADYYAGSTSKFIPDSIDYVKTALRVRDLDLMRVLDRFIPEHRAEHILRAASGMIASGISPAAITKEHLDATKRVNDNLVLIMIRSKEIRTTESERPLRERAVDLVMQNLQNEERVIYLVKDCGVTDPDQLTIRLRGMEDTHISLIDGAL